MNNGRDQRGVILVVALIFLLLISIVAVSGARRALIAERLGFNHWEQERAFQAAEAALVDGSQWLNALTEIDDPEGSANGGSGIWEQGSLQSKIYDPAYDWSEEAIKFGQYSDASESWFSRPPYYLIENVGWVADDASPEHASAGLMTFFYNVTAQGYGSGEHSRAVVQSTLSKRFK